MSTTTTTSIANIFFFMPFAFQKAIYGRLLEGSQLKSPALELDGDEAIRLVSYYSAGIGLTVVVAHVLQRQILACATSAIGCTVCLPHEPHVYPLRFTPAEGLSKAV